jgi:tetratricopeptide (TPR) repeat protein
MSINWPRFVEIVNAHGRFLLVSHVRPDCDALGSELGMAGVLEALGNAAAAQRDFAAAITLYRRTLEFAPDSIPVRANLANSLLVTGQVDEAIAHYQEVLRRNPGDRRAEENLAIALEIQRTRSR